jgi:uncharacterized protein (TIGR03067 family)
MRRVLLLSALLTPVPMAFAQEKTDKDKMQGEWKLVSFVARGGKDVIPRESVDKAKVLVKGDKIVLFGKGFKAELGFKLDTTKTPKAIDLFESGREGKMLGIYMLKEKELTLVWSADRKGERPTELNLEKGLGRSDGRMMVLKR